MLLQVEYSDLACDEETPVCGATCDKLLPCGRHRCAERCHHGTCTTHCRAMVDKACVCGKTHKIVPCHETLRYVLTPGKLVRRADFWSSWYMACVCGKTHKIIPCHENLRYDMIPGKLECSRNENQSRWCHAMKRSSML